MNIAVFIKRTTLHKGFGGLETQNKALCEGLVKRGHKITVYSPKYDLDTDLVTSNEVTYKFIDSSYRSFAGFGHLDKNNWINRSAEEFKKDHFTVPFNLVLAQSSAGLGVVRQKEEFNIPIISVSHGTTVGELKTTFQSLNSVKDFVMLVPKFGYFLLNFFGRQREFVLNSNKVIAVSKVVKKALIEETLVDESLVEVIYNGIDQNVSRTRQSDKVKLLYAGLIHWSKGFGDLLDVLEDIDTSNIYVEIIGDGEHLDKLQKEVKRRRLEDIVGVLGHLSPEDLSATMLDSDIFILPSKRMEGFPMAIIEAMFAQIPAIGSDMGGIPEAVEDGVTGIVYKSGNKKALREAIERLVNNKSLREQMGKNALEKARKEFSLDVMLNRYERVFDEVLK